MANNTISLRNQRLFDEAAIAQSAPYVNNGLTYKSNDINIHPRDESGNIILQENSETNPLLVIEPVVNNVLNSSVLRVVDTTFQYYKFPVTTRTTPTADLDVNIELQQTDPVYARYKPATDWTIGFSSGTYSGILMDEVVEGLSQTNTNCYTVSKDVKNSGKDLRFRIKITHRFSSDAASDFGTIYWSIMKVGPNYPTQGGLDRDWKTGYASARSSTTNFNQLIQDIAVIMLDACDDPAGIVDDKAKKEQPWWDYWKQFDVIPPDQVRLTGNQIEAINYVRSRDPKKIPRTSESSYTSILNRLAIAIGRYNAEIEYSSSNWGVINRGTNQVLYIDEIIRNSEFEIGDIFQIGANTGQEGHIVLNNQTYFVITDASKTVDIWNQEIIE